MVLDDESQGVEKEGAGRRGKEIQKGVGRESGRGQNALPVLAVAQTPADQTSAEEVDTMQAD